jgi:hypothetical protein
MLIIPSVTMYSPRVDIYVGKGEKAFTIDKDLLALHSQYFRNRFAEADENEQFTLPHVKEEHFVFFKSWLYTGDWLHIGNALSTPTTGEELWALGTFLKAPAFQNYCMDDIRQDAKNERNHWVYIKSVESVYKVSKKTSMLRKFTADVLCCHNPFDKHKPGSKDRADWERLMDRCHDIAVDMAKAAVKKWNGTNPWDDEHRGSYMEEEVPLGDLWEQQILSRRSRADIEKAAKAKCIQSVIELEHLKR